MSKNITYYSRETLEEFYTPRKGETKVGDAIPLVKDINDLKNTAAPFVLIGIAEDIGVRGNLGVPGCAQTFAHFLKAFLNIQVTDHFNADQVALLGVMEFEEEMAEAEELKPSKPRHLERIRNLTYKIDLKVIALMEQVFKAGKTPVIIGGGHNNAYGLLRALSQAKGVKVNAFNIDPHADFRALEGRHSGNGFSYASAEGYLDKYHVFGWHQGYNNQNMTRSFAENQALSYTTFEALLSQTEEETLRDLVHQSSKLQGAPLGFELDMDSVTHFPVSAYNPSGFELNTIRKMVRLIAFNSKPAYFHITEAAPALAATSQLQSGAAKALAYLVFDFIKAS